MLSGLLFTADLHSNHGGVSSFARKIFRFCGFSSVSFLLLIQAGEGFW